MKNQTWWERRLEAMKQRQEDFLGAALKGRILPSEVLSELYLTSLWIPWIERYLRGDDLDLMIRDLRKEFESAVFTEGLPLQHLRTLRAILTRLEEEKIG